MARAPWGMASAGADAVRLGLTMSGARSTSIIHAARTAQSIALAAAAATHTAPAPKAAQAKRKRARSYMRTLMYAALQL